ncbi:hypothetical protein DOTSEDRAFT_68856 [Lecanosticta acicola]|uniref:Pre-mRNA splicing factor CLF1 n=1 Tax=Lecanosticta acicola TaxID=111012 RepID=A0AAI8Z420_9PEZI|nr:hypothetical protein DOTSEDRAFT_68856 [Lecanosticta acicola]
MSVPKPSRPLSGNCAAIDSNTLYSYSPDAFQSLPLKENATWSNESNGKSVNSPACVKAGDGPEASLYVIGGDSDSNDYLGLQRYSFSNQSWETLTPPVEVLKSRTNHSVAYLGDSQSILVYGGSTPEAPSLLSSQTFLISTVPPYNIRSFTSKAPPTNSAILQSWNSSHAVMVGGAETNTDVWLFGPEDGWHPFGTNLSQPISSAARAVVVDGTDGSKVLQVYNVDVSPNTAQGIVLLGSNGRPAPTGQTLGDESPSTSSNKRKRELSLENWPSYNATNAPTSTRPDCSISRTADGLVVMAGGNSENPIIMFNQTKNSWVDASKFFNSKQEQQPLVPSSTSNPTSIPTETAEPSSTTAAGSGGLSAHDKTLRTLGITLGVLCGIAALFILVLLYLRWRKMKAKKKNGGYLEEKNGDGDASRMSFADRGASFMKEAGGSVDDLGPPNRDRFGANNNSHSSLAIIAGKIGNKRYTGANHATKGSFESTAHLVKDREGNLVPGENHEMIDIGDKLPLQNGDNLTVPGAVAHGSSLDKETRAERKRSSGWSKYFATSQPTGPNGLSHLPSAYVKPSTASVASEYSSDQVPSPASRIPSSALVPPLDIDFSKTVDGQRLSHVAQGSPAYFDSREAFALRGGSLDVGDGQRGVIVDPGNPRKSQPDSISSFGNRSTISSSVASEYYNDSAHTPWTPMSGHRDHERVTSSVYTNSVVYSPNDRVPSRGKSAGFFPGAGTMYRPSKVKLSHNAGPTSEWASPRMPAARAEARDSTSSSVTVFPSANDFETTPSKEIKAQQQAAPGAQEPRQSRPQSQRRSQRKSEPYTQDMSWLDLGLNKNQS